MRGGGERFVERPEQSPRSNGLQFPVYPAEARRAGVRARARVRVLVGADDRTVSRRDRRADADRPPRARDERRGASPRHGAGALDAARQHEFAAARDGGERVRSYANIVIQIGVDR